MKVAVVHDWLNHKAGGAEIVLADILNLYPEADLYSLIYEPKLFSELVGNRKIITSFLQRFPKRIKRSPKFLLPFIKRAIESFKFDGYDLVISSSGAWSKNINIPKESIHICYCHTPARMLWVDWPKYLDDINFWGFKYIPFLKLATVRLVSKLRIWDYYKSEGVDEFIANSKYVADRIKKFYGRDSVVIYPGIDMDKLKLYNEGSKSDYYLVISTLAKYKNINVIISAFIKNKKRLIIAGTGAMEGALREQAKGHNNIELLGYVSEDKKISLLKRAKGFVFANIEDFGIAPVEALASATPVIALRGGGLSETVTDAQSGVFFNTPSPEHINRAIEKFENIIFNNEVIVATAQKYNKRSFEQGFEKIIRRKINR